MPNILVIEDDSDINNLLCSLLEQNNYGFMPAFSGTEGLLLLQSNTFDLVLLDLMLPGKDGLEVLQVIKDASSKNSNVPVIMLTAIDSKEQVVTLLKAGANDYVTKPFDNDELIARIQNQLRPMAPSIKATSLSYNDLVLNEERFDGFIDGEALGLSKLEYNILHLLMEYPQKVFTKNNLYESVWQNEFLGDDNTINVHISKLRSKIARLRPDDEYIQTVWGIGFKMK